MGFTKALYYPTIDINNEDWLKNAVLFWDEINTIVPESITNPYQTESSKYLSDQGVLRALNVNPDVRIIEDLTSDVIKYLNTNEGFQLLTQGQGNRYIHRDKLPRDITRLFDIHPEKLSHELQYQLRNNMTNEGWFRVNSNFATFYLTLLANKICEQKSIALLTDNTLNANFSDLVRLDNQIVLTNNEEHYFRNRSESHLLLSQGMLINMVFKGIRVSKNTNLKDIVKFKNNHQDELGLFRANISKMTKDIPSDGTFESLQQQVCDIYQDEFLPAYNNFKRALDSSGIKWTSDNFLKVSTISTSATSVPLALLGLTIPHALIAGIGVSLIASLVSYNEEKKERYRTSPYSYLLSANETL